MTLGVLDKFVSTYNSRKNHIVSHTPTHNYYEAHLRVDIEGVCTLKCLALRLWIVQQKALFHNEEPSGRNDCQ